MENEPTTKTPIPTTSGFRNFAFCTCLHPDPLGLIFAFSTYLSCREFIATEPPFLSMDYFSVSSAFSVAISFVPPWLCGQWVNCAKQSQFQNGQYRHKYSSNKALSQRTTNNEQRTLSKTNPIKPNSPALPGRNMRYEIRSQTAPPQCVPGFCFQFPVERIIYPPILQNSLPALRLRRSRL